MKRRKTTVKGSTRAVTGIERIAHLQEQLARAPANSRRRQELRGAIRVETDAYRKSLDSEQAAATHDAKPTHVRRLAEVELPLPPATPRSSSSAVRRAP